MLSIHGLSEEDLAVWLTARGEKPYRTAQLLQWVYKKGTRDWEAMTDLNKSLRRALAQELSCGSLECVQTVDSGDGETTKFLWRLPDGLLVESVLIRSRERRTVCVSSQVGCPARCAFCASGRQGLVRNLAAAEIVEQAYLIDDYLRPRGERITHVVFMGMGEPLENYEEVVKAIRLLTHPQRLGLSQRRVTVSTVGVVEAIARLSSEEFRVNLVLSLHAPNQRIRQKLIPYARRYPMEAVLGAMTAYAAATKRDVTYEYTLMQGVNDQPGHARELASLLADQQCTVNLIPYNPVEGLKLRRPPKETIEEFRSILEDSGIATTWRYTKGKDIAAACGQLALRQQKL
jgi:23S rRNA (adenine2503-C2)-methyltransferase